MKVSPIVRFVGAVVMAVGAMIVLLSGACTLNGLKYGGVITLLVGGAFVAFGVWVFRSGLRLFNGD